MKSGKRSVFLWHFDAFRTRNANPGVLSENQTHIENVVGRCAG